MTYWITNLHGDSERDNRVLANKNIAQIAQKMGFKTIDYILYEDISNQIQKRHNIIETLLAPVKPRDVLVVQFPLWIRNGNFQQELLTYCRKYLPQVKLVAYIHDLHTWLRKQDYDKYQDPLLRQLRNFDLVIAHNPRFAQRLVEDDVKTSILTANLFDWIHKGPLQTKKYLKQVYYVLGRNVKLEDYEGDTPITIIGPKGTDRPNIHFTGPYPASRLPYLFEGGFGLVDMIKNLQTSTEIYDWDQYSSYNNPSKLSLYLAAGLPVIISAHSAHADWVKKYGLGLVLEDLNQIDNALNRVTAADYQKMLEAIVPWQRAVSTGFFATRALTEAVRYLELDQSDRLFYDGEAQQKKFLTYLQTHTFAFTLLPSYEKFGLFQFLDDGRIGGVGGRNESRWDIRENQLRLLNKSGRATATFPIHEENLERIEGYSTNQNHFHFRLIPTEINRIETLKLSPNQDKQNTASLTQPGPIQELKSLTLANKMIDGSYQGQYFILDRKADFLGLQEFEGVMYEVEPPKEDLDYLSPKLLVVFSSFAGAWHLSARGRYFEDGVWRSLSGSLAKNTSILRIADSNLFTGSYYHNTENFPDYEEKIQGLIQEVAKNHGISQDHIFLHGNSKGGTGALLHGLLGNYPFLATDPVVDRKLMMHDYEHKLMFDQLPDSFSKKISSLARQSSLIKDQKMLLTNKKLETSYSNLEKLNLEDFKVYNLEMDKKLLEVNHDAHHGFILKTVPLVLSIVNQWLYNRDLEVE